MDRSDVIYLVSKVLKEDEFGVQNAATEERQVFCHVDSVTANEFFEGGRNGIQSQYRFRINRFDYNNEQIVKYNGCYYGVYRTYIGTNDDLDLYVESKKGI